VPQHEITGNRPSNFSAWHRRELPDWCLMTDGDFFLQVAIDEHICTTAYLELIQVPSVENVTHGSYKIWPSKDALCREIMKHMGIPSFIVYHNSECTDFLIFDFQDSIYRRMSAKQYVNFEILLRRNFICNLEASAKKRE